MPPPVEGSSQHYFTPEAIRTVALEIADARGVEVFFVGRRGENGLVEEVEAHAYGSPDTVPALLNLLRPGEIFIHNHPDGYLMPSEADLNVASIVGNQGVGCYIVNNDCSQVRIVVRPHDAKKKVPLETGDVLRRLAPGSRLERALDHFEDRPQQRTMAAAVAGAFNNDGIAVVEAGTGTGKSLAYLMPAVLFALRNQERVVISTNTINLQEQLLHKDVPALRQALGEEFTVEIVKGRGNYVCRRKAQYAAGEAESLLEDDYVTELKEVLAWVRSSPTGDRQELPLQARDEVWERVASEADNCLRVRCPFYETCFFYNSRRRAARATLLIVNHSLLMSDLAVRRASGNWSAAAVLPPYTRVIIDEAHHLEEVATRNLAQQVTRFGLRQLLGRLYRRERGDGRGVFLSMTEAIDTAAKSGRDDLSHLSEGLHSQLIPRLLDVRESIDFHMTDFAAEFKRAARLATPRRGETYKVRVTRALRDNEVWREQCEATLAALASEIGRFVEQNTKLIESMEDLDEKVRARLINPATEWEAIVGRLEGARRTILQFLADDDDSCRWVELSEPERGREIIRLCAAPVDVREVLREALHDRMKSEVLTSATLTVDREFSFFEERTGLPIDKGRNRPPERDEDGMPVILADAPVRRPLEAVQLDAPFDYGRQVFLGVPMDLGDPRSSDFDRRLADMVSRAVYISGGRAFVLFTSHAQMNRVHDMCEREIRRLGVQLMKQGTASRHKLLHDFREDETSVLFATSSFWEGVDVKGRALELLIIARLPFSVPTEPIQEAQFEALKAQGRDPFDALVVPRAVIRLKQGFGRLIRSRTDRGAVLIADERVVTQRYGRRFVHSLPDLQLRRSPTEALMNDMRAFFGESAAGRKQPA